MAMPEIKMKNKDKTQRLLVLTADIDNDLYKKTRISGPVLGRVQNLSAANQLILADPEETDANAIFQAVKLYDELKEGGYLVNVATITGSETEGYEADREIARQLELVLKNYKADACIFVTDGASDNRVLPIIESRLKINAVKTVTMKQSEKLENTYFVVLDKLKDPHYARILFGIPAMLLLLFALSYYFGLGWEIPVLLIGIYLAIKGFGIEDMIISSFRGFGFSLDRLSFVFYLSAIIFFLASLFVAYGNYATFSQLDSPSVAAYTIEGFLLLIPLSLMLYLVGRIFDITGKKYMFRSFKYGNYIGSSVIFWIIAYSFSAWIIGQIYFSQFINYTITAIILGIAISLITRTLKTNAIKSRRLKGKTVINELGALIGKVNKIDSRKGMMQINTGFGNNITYSIDRIVDVSDKVVIS
jgi:putative membrane protein